MAGGNTERAITNLKSGTATDWHGRRQCGDSSFTRHQAPRSKAHTRRMPQGTRHVPKEQIVTKLGIQLVWRHFFAIWEISSFACLSNLISDSLRRRGVEQVTRFRACKAVIAESEVVDPLGFEIRPVYFKKMDDLLLIAGKHCRVGLASQDGSTDHTSTAMEQKAT